MTHTSLYFQCLPWCLVLGLQGDPTSPFWRRSVLEFLWREWCWSWNCSTLATSCKELTHWKRLWCWEGLGAGGEGDDREWDGWMASLTRWMWTPGVSDGQGGLACCDSWGCEESDTTERLKWTELKRGLIPLPQFRTIWITISGPKWSSVVTTYLTSSFAFLCLPHLLISDVTEIMTQNTSYMLNFISESVFLGPLVPDL